MLPSALVVSLLMVVAGSLNTMCTKWANSFRPPSKEIPFKHPFLQAVCMLFGEFLCLIVFFIMYGYKNWQRKRATVSSEPSNESCKDFVPFTATFEGNGPISPKFNPFVFLPLAFYNVFATLFMYIGVCFTTYSSYGDDVEHFHMLKGSVIIFTGILSIFVLGDDIRQTKWFGIFVTFFGFVMVGVSDEPHPYNHALDPKRGCVFIIIAEIIVAIQMVYEQKYIRRHNLPALLVVGLEGLSGILILSFLLVPMYYIHCPLPFSLNPEGRLEDVFNALQEIKEVPMIAVPLIGNAVWSAIFNFAGVSVTKELSATTRMVIDTSRFVIIWAVSIPLFGEGFIPMQLLGFAVIIVGIVIYVDFALGSWFNRSILSNMQGDSVCARFCFLVCSSEVQESNRNSLLDKEKSAARV